MFSHFVKLSLIAHISPYSNKRCFRLPYIKKVCFSVFSFSSTLQGIKQNNPIKSYFF